MSSATKKVTMQVASRCIIIALAASLLLLLSSLRVTALTTTTTTTKTIRNQKQDNHGDSSITKSVHSKSEHSRRGFIASCTAAVACSMLAAPSPSNAMMSRRQIRHNLANNDPPFHHTSDAKSNSQQISSATEQEETTPKQSTTLTAFQESISGFISGSAVSTVKTMVKYPLDTATVRLQMPNTQYAVDLAGLSGRKKRNVLIKME